MKKLLTTILIVIIFACCKKYMYTIDVIYTDGTTERINVNGHDCGCDGGNVYMEDGCLHVPGANIIAFRCGVRSFIYYSTEIKK